MPSAQAANCAVTVDLAALCKNYTLLTAHANKKAKKAPRPICVLKADAYGHGAEACAAALYSMGADFFAVASVDEGAKLRQVLPDARILVLSPALPAALPSLIRARLVATVASVKDIMAVRSAAREAWRTGTLPRGCCVPCHVKLDSGMHRLGFPVTRAEEAERLADRLSLLAQEGGWRACGVFSHLATADDPSPRGNELLLAQGRAFFHAAVLLRRRGLCPHAHLANSAALLRFGGMGLWGYRMGIALYGIPPSEVLPFRGALAGIRPVMSMHAHITRISVLERGQGLGYGSAFVAPCRMRVATVSCGYADGLLRAASGGFLSLHGRAVRIIGRICMDQCFLAIGDLAANVGDPVTVFGTDADISALAAAAKTIPYELLTLASRRAARCYLPS